MVDIVVAGLAPHFLPYPDALALQRATHAEVIAGTADDTLLLLEHSAVYTAGSRTEAGERPSDGSPVLDVDRGGKITWHGPGQLVGYPILALADPIDVVAYVRRLEAMLIEVVQHFGIEGRQVPGRSGVWIVDAWREEKIAAIGVRVAHGVTMHGFALNCNNSLEPYSHIVACGIRDAGITTIARETGVDVTPAQAAVEVAERFARIVLETPAKIPNREAVSA